MSEREMSLTVEATNVLQLIKQSLYSEREVFLRELVSNSLDALRRVDKTYRLSSDFQDDLQPLKVDIHLDPVNRRLTISDNGDGMSENEVIRNINHIAYSGARKFAEENLHERQGMIGRFGVGFYSCFMVSDRVEIDTWSWRPNAGGCHWSGEGGATVKLRAPSRRVRGTTVTCHLSRDADEFLAVERLVQLIRRYLDFAPYPIFLEGRQENLLTAPWHLSRTEQEALPRSRFLELFERLNPGENQPLQWFPIEVEFPLELRGLLFVPQRNDNKAGKIRLFNDRIFVSDHLNELLPVWLGFLDGVLDSTDLPINVSRERFRLDRRIQQVGQFLTNKAVDYLVRMTKERRQDYLAIWERHGIHVKRGYLETTMNRNDKLAAKLERLLLFDSDRQHGATLSQYQERQSEADRNQFLYLTDERTQAVHLELWRNRNREVLFCTHPLDSLIVELLKQAHPDWQLLRVDEAPLVPDSIQSNEAQEAPQSATTSVQALSELMRRISGGGISRISAVSLPSKEIPAVLQLGDGWVQKELLNKLMANELAERPDRTLLLNTDSTLIQRLIALCNEGSTSEIVLGLATQLWDHVRLNAGMLSEDELMQVVRRNAEFLTLVAQEMSQRT